jgi:hypothetical protein
MSRPTQTTEAVFPFTAYDVTVDRDSVASWDLGGDGIGFAVQLSGAVDERWMRCYTLARIHTPGFARFHLDPEKKIVWFAGRSDDNAGKIQPVLDTLARLVAASNQAAEAEAWDQWGETTA